MALRNAANAVLTQSQAELTAKVNSMKSLLALPLNPSRNVPKEDQISTFDYLLRVLRSMGLAPEPIFRLFIEKIFNETGDFLDQRVIEAIGSSLDSNGIQISPNQSNTQFIKDQGPSQVFSQAAKRKMAEELTLMIFGGENERVQDLAAGNDEEDKKRRAQEVKDQAVCGSNMFTLSNNPTVRNQDVEYNRIQLREELEKGEVTYQINCQDVKISLPQEPRTVFTGGGTGTIPDQELNPADKVNQVVNYVGNRTQEINNQNNANSVGRTFFEQMLEKLLSYITTLVFPYVGSVFSFLQNQQPQNSNQLTADNIISTPCDIANDPQNAQKKEFSRSLINALYKELLKMLLVFVIREFKKLVQNYFARTAQEKIRRKAEKIRMKFQIFSDVAQTANRASKFESALQSLQDILGEDTNIV